MKFNEAVEQATQSDDVEGIPKRYGKMVRRKVPAGYTVMSKGNAKKKKKEDEDDEKDLEELLTQMSPEDDMHAQAKFWRGKKKAKGTTVKGKKKDEEDDEDDE